MSGQEAELITAADCGHKVWAFGCETCWREVLALAQKEALAASRDAEESGAVLMLWHVVGMMENLRRQAEPMMRSIDLQKSQVAQSLVANLDQLTGHFVELMRTPGALRRVLDVTQRIMSKVGQEEKEGSRVVLTDEGGRDGD